MNQLPLFSSGVELADLLVNSGLLSCSWDAIIDTQRSYLNCDPTLPSVRYKLHHSPNVTIIAFASSPLDTVNHLQTHGRDLVSSEELKGWSFNLFEFVATKVNPSFAIHRAAVAMFHSLLNELTGLKNQRHNSSSYSFLIVTGNCLGGSIASLFTLWLLDGMLPTASKRPLCITFGSPLLGDKCFQQAISERPTWNSSFLHVVSYKDVVPYLFIPQMSGGSIPQTCAYMPFGTFLLCSESGCACFEEPESVLELLMAMGSNFAANPSQLNSLQITDYRQILQVLVHNSIYRRPSPADDLPTNLQAGIMMQLVAIGVGTQGHGGDLNSLTTTTAERVKRFRTSRRNGFDPNKKLTERKIDMTYLEWYKTSSKDQGGYYDSYKNRKSGSREQIKTRLEVVKRHRILTQYWKRMVNEVEKMPQQEGANFRMRWLYGGTNYRRLVEPLDIVEYYMKGHRDYLTNGRSQHYVLLEKWFNDAKPVDGANERRNKACSLTEDSCFWARVEEAIISCKVLRDGQASWEQKRLSMCNLVGFEHYVMDSIKNFAVSAEIFLPESSFMKWWGEYCVLGDLDHLPLANFMRSDYQNYA